MAVLVEKQSEVGAANIRMAEGARHLILCGQDERLPGRAMKEASIQVVFPDPGLEGYVCIHHMARLAAELLDGELFVFRPGQPTLADKLGGMVLPRKRSGSACLLI